jgi:hypothetical protein
MEYKTQIQSVFLFFLILLSSFGYAQNVSNLALENTYSK